MSRTGPGQSYPKGITLMEVIERFSTEEKAEEWFIEQRWPDGIACPKCGSRSVARPKSRKPMPFRCRDCRKHFSIRTDTVLQNSNLPLRKWAIGFYLFSTNLKGVSSMKLHRDLGITQKAAWHMAHRIRETMVSGGIGRKFEGPVEADETYIGGKESNKHASKKLNAGRGMVGKAPVAGVKDQATNQVSASPVPGTDKATLQGFVADRTVKGVKVYTDDWGAYHSLPNHEVVKHGAGEYVKGMAHTNGLESFWALLKRGYVGTYHKMSVKHLHRYVNEFQGRHNRAHSTQPTSWVS